MNKNRDAQAKGFQDNLYLELDTYHNPPAGTKSRLKQAILQELSAANIFLVLKTGEIVTPSLKRGTILPGEHNLYVICNGYLHLLSECYLCIDYLYLLKL